MGSISQPAAYDSWTRHMKAGEFHKAWQISDELIADSPAESTRHLPRHLQRVWNGVDPAGRHVLVRCNHGLGDTIQFARYLPMVKQVAARLEVEAQPVLKKMIESMNCCDHIYDLDAAENAIFDVEIEIMELQHVFRSSFETIPRSVPYFNIERRFPQSGLPAKVGLVWRAGDWDDRRSIPFVELLPLFQIERVQFVILQREADAAGWLGGYGMPANGRTLDDDAKTIASLDLMISVDTMTAHLAGSLATEVWTLLHSDADWRWLEDREDSPWYPTMKLFRQDRAGDWGSVIERVRGELVERFQ
jgi:hypothetical protein